MATASGLPDPQSCALPEPIGTIVIILKLYREMLPARSRRPALRAGVQSPGGISVRTAGRRPLSGLPVCDKSVLSGVANAGSEVS